MKRTLYLVAVVIIALACNNIDAQNLVANHNTVNFDEIPTNYIDSIKTSFKIHYAHRSHGKQLSLGAERLEAQNSLYNVDVGNRRLGTEDDALCFFDGQYGIGYVTTNDYYATKAGMDNTRNVLDSNPEINISMFCFCRDWDEFNIDQVDDYFDSLAVLESEYPHHTFVYFTGNAQEVGSMGYNRHLNNEKIRTISAQRNKILYDFGDLDAWYYDGSSWDQETYDYEGNTVPSEHSQYDGEDIGHTTNESAEIKAKALWWLLYKIFINDITPVELINYNVENFGSKVHLSWVVGSETNNHGFEIERAYESGNFEKIAFVNGRGTSATTFSYSFTDEKLETVGSYSYRIKQVDVSGEYEYLGTKTIYYEGPREYKLSQNYPNPFNPSTTIEFQTVKNASVKVSVYDLLGREVKTLVNSRLDAGNHKVNFLANNLPSGIYLYSLSVDGQMIANKKMSLLK